MVLKNLPVALGLSIVVLNSGIIQAKPLQERLDEAQERLLSKNGIELTGAIKSEYLQSSLSGSAVVDTNYSYETTQFTSLDLGMQYRAYDFVSARVDLRFQQDWQTFFAGTRSRVLAARWLSIDGNLANTLSYNAGDFRQKYTPLTVWSPEVDLIYEPLIFSRRRAELMEEQYLGENNRILQGGNLNLARGFDGPLSEIRVDALGSRLRRAEFLDSNGAQGFSWNRSDMDRFLFAGNAEALGWRNILLGATVMRLADDKKSYQQSLYSPAFRQLMREYLESDPTLDSSLLVLDGESLNGRNSVVARDITLVGGHGGLDLGGFLDNQHLILNLTAEFAQSKETDKQAWAFRRDSVSKAIVPFETVLPETKGKAYHVELVAGYQGEDSLYGIRLTGRFLKNEAKFINPVAQSPSFIPTRILNTENDMGSGALYSTFDALNNGVYKFSSSRQTKSTQQSPYTKSAYNNGILSPEDLASMPLDPVVQLVMPSGLATANRQGPSLRLEGHFKNALHGTVDADILKEVEGQRMDSVVLDAAKYTRFGGGIKVGIGDLLEWSLPLDFSGSYIQSKYTRAKHASEIAAPDITTDLVLAGFNYRFLPKWAVLGGVEYSKATLPTNFGTEGYISKVTQTHYRTGVEFSVTQSARLLVSGGMNKVEETRNQQGSPATPTPSLNGKSDFSQLLAQALIHVKF